MAKVREIQHMEGGLGGGHWEDRVRLLADGEETPEGAQIVPDDMQEHDWQPLRDHPDTS